MIPTSAGWREAGGASVKITELFAEEQREMRELMKERRSAENGK